jgi:molybdenum cofactor biosynthesis protein B
MDKVIVPDDRKRIEVQLRRWINEPNVEVVLATGGTGVTGRDVTPEAFEGVWEKPIPGFGELFRMLSYEQIGTSTIQSRACAGVARGTYLFALPGSTGACRDAWDGILRYQLDIRYRPCNFAELVPRLQETYAPAPVSETVLCSCVTGGRLATGVLAIGQSGHGGTRYGVPTNGSACNCGRTHLRGLTTQASPRRSRQSGVVAP